MASGELPRVSRGTSNGGAGAPLSTASAGMDPNAHRVPDAGAVDGVTATAPHARAATVPHSAASMGDSVGRGQEGFTNDVLRRRELQRVPRVLQVVPEARRRLRGLRGAGVSQAVPQARRLGADEEAEGRANRRAESRRNLCVGLRISSLALNGFDVLAHDDSSHSTNRCPERGAQCDLRLGFCVPSGELSDDNSLADGAANYLKRGAHCGRQGGAYSEGSITTFAA